MAIENNDNKKKTTIWLRPSMIARMDGWLQTDNCDSRSEFIEKALRFYMGHLAAEDQTEFLSDALCGVMRGMVEANTHRICRMLFKQCVELNMMSHVIAAHYKADPIDVRALRAFAVDEVKHTNGAVSFYKSLAHQRKLWMDDDYDD
jgi:metal-responsive CopG/Arc/MetJ family transcriptional regulator